MSESRKPKVLSVDDAVSAMRDAADAVVDAVGRAERDHQDEVFELEQEVDQARDESRGADMVESWVASVVREADGKALDGLSPEAILAWLLSTLRAERGLYIAHNLVA